MINQKIAPYLKPKTIVFFQGRDDISKFIINCENMYWKEQGLKSQWSHIGFVGSDGRFYESSIRIYERDQVIKFLGMKFNSKYLKLANGAQSWKLEERFEDKMTHKEERKMGFQTLDGISDAQWLKITKEAQAMIAKKYQYALFENIGTLINIIRWKFFYFLFNKKKADQVLKDFNIFDDKKALYCCAFVSDAIEKVLGVPYIVGNNSVSTVDGGWYSPMPHTNSPVIGV